MNVDKLCPVLKQNSTVFYKKYYEEHLSALTNFHFVSFCKLIKHWVENNPTNIRMFLLTSIFLLPRGTTLTAFADVDTDVARC
jgi:hypothetical protein